MFPIQIKLGASIPLVFYFFCVLNAYVKTFHYEHKGRVGCVEEVEFRANEPLKKRHVHDRRDMVRAVILEVQRVQLCHLTQRANRINIVVGQIQLPHLNQITKPANILDFIIRKIKLD